MVKEVSLKDIAGKVVTDDKGKAVSVGEMRAEMRKKVHEERKKAMPEPELEPKPDPMVDLVRAVNALGDKLTTKDTTSELKTVFDTIIGKLMDINAKPITIKAPKPTEIASPRQWTFEIMRNQRDGLIEEIIATAKE